MSGTTKLVQFEERGSKELSLRIEAADEPEHWKIYNSKSGALLLVLENYPTMDSALEAATKYIWENKEEEFEFEEYPQQDSAGE